MDLVALVLVVFAGLLRPVAVLEGDLGMLNVLGGGSGPAGSSLLGPLDADADDVLCPLLEGPAAETDEDEEAVAFL